MDLIDDSFADEGGRVPVAALALAGSNVAAPAAASAASSSSKPVGRLLVVGLSGKADMYQRAMLRRRVCHACPVTSHGGQLFHARHQHVRRHVVLSAHLVIGWGQ